MKTEDIVGENAFEAYKCLLDYLKHITTVCSAVSLVAIALYKDIVVADFQIILITSIGLFIAAAGASIITHLVFLIPNFEGQDRIRFKKNAGLGLLITVLSAMFGFFFLLLYVVLTLHVKS